MKNGTNKEITGAIGMIEEQFIEHCNPSIMNKLNDLKEDLNNDFFTIIVLGEFKRGKSTFVNALLGTKLLPVDVIPTTATINALMWGEEKKAYVVKNDGEIESGDSSLSFLSRYIASEDFEIDKIKYLKIGYPAEILRNNIVLVDTPGVSDLNEQRVQVTYDFIPRADAVIFLLDATAPLKRTEKEFLDEHLVKLGIDRVLFIANKFDNIDEDDEEEVLEDIERRIKKSFNANKQEQKFKDFTVLPVSSSMALDGALQNNENILVQSGMPKAKEHLLRMVQEGSMADGKIQRYKSRTLDIIEAIERGINNDIQLRRIDRDGLKKLLANIEDMLEEEGSRKVKISTYIETEEQNIQAMVKRSLNYFRNNLKEEVNELIDNYKGTDFKHYVEMTIQSLIKKRMNSWVSTYYISIDKLLEKLEREISIGLANYFKTKLVMQSNTVNKIEFTRENNMIAIEAEDISNVTTKAGLISAGIAGLTMMIGGPILMPFISMAAYPVIQKKMLENKLNDAKINVKPEINEALNACVSNLEHELSGNISKRIENIKQMTEYTYDQLFASVRNAIQLEIDKRKNQRDDIGGQVLYLEEKLKTLNELKEQLL